MDPVDLLLITWNRRHYVEKTLDTLFESDANFKLYCWDNNSEDGTAEIIAALDDPRVVRKHFSKENVKQRAPVLWFFEQATSDLVGKIDDDILLPHNWIETIAPIVRENPRAGMIGCWIFMEEDWDGLLAEHKYIKLGEADVFHNMWIAGQSFLARLDCVKKYIYPENVGYGFPIDQYQMTADGLINGYPIPILFAHNMDDPRSSHYHSEKEGGIGLHGALTARVRGFKNAEEYGHWIAEDARNMLIKPVSKQVREACIQRDQSFTGKVRRKIYKVIGL